MTAMVFSPQRRCTRHDWNPLPSMLISKDMTKYKYGNAIMGNSSFTLRPCKGFSHTSHDIGPIGF